MEDPRSLYAWKAFYGPVDGFCSMKRTGFCTKVEAAKMLGVSTPSVERIAKANGIRVLTLPGHKRKLFFRKDLQRILSAADLACEAGAGA